jgi:hypothetical protein
MRRRLFPLLPLFLSLLLPLNAAAGPLTDALLARKAGFVPRTADNIGKQLDEQLLRLLGPSGYGRETVSIACTVPVDLGNLRHTSPLARQMAEELARCLVAQGYVVDELRKGSEVLMVRERGEFLLTREAERLQSRDIRTELVLAGTYTVTAKSVRFNIRLLHTPGQEVVAMGAGTVPVTPELVPLLADSDTPPPPLQPTVRTRLPR